MIIANGPRKWIIIGLCLAPVLIAFLLFNIYPIVFNIQASFTNMNSRNYLTANYRDVGTRNYEKMLADLFQPEALAAFGTLLLAVVPLVVCFFLVRRLNKADRYNAPNTLPYWLVALVAAVVIYIVVNGPGQIATLERTGDFFIVVFRSLVYTLITIPIIFFIAIGLSLILINPSIRFKTMFRTLLILPWIVPFYIAALIWRNFFFGEASVMNQILSVFGVTNPPTWLDNPITAFIVIIIVQVWFTYPFAMSVTLGALQSIPGDMYEAADVDGAPWYTQLFKITLPMLRPAIIPIVIMTSLSTFLIGESVYLITGGLPTLGVGRPGATDLVMVYAYRRVFENGFYGESAAFAVILFPFLLIATLLIFRVTNATRSAYE
ncbi:MAG: sugar ABC transporter permease [Anaerolineae bacterium]|nr:sugar ABC transporter permease [Anaerolineae bacterium]